MCILRIGLVIITAGICGIYAEGAETAVAANAAGEPVVIKDGAAMVPVTTIVVDPAAHPIEKAAAKELQSYLVRIGSVQLPIVESAEAVPAAQGMIFVGPGKAAGALCEPATLRELGPDGPSCSAFATATLWRRAGTIAELLMPYTDCSSTWAAVSTPGNWRSCRLRQRSR